MEIVAAAVAAVLVLAPLVLLALRGTRWDPLPRTVSAPDETALAADPDLRRTLVERAALNARRDQADAGGGYSPTSPIAQPWAPSRASASSAAAIAASSRFCASP